MLNLQRFALCAALVAGALTISPQASTSTWHGRTGHDVAFPMPSTGMSIGADGEQTLAQLVEEFSKVTGEQLLYSKDTSTMLSQAKTGLRSTLELHPQDVYSVVQDVLVFNGFVLMNIRREEPRMLALASLHSPERASMKANAMFVKSEELDDYAGDSALLIQTVVHVPNLDVRTMGNSMRQLVVDPNTLQIIPIPESNTVILTGFGSTLHELVSLLEAMDEAAGLQVEHQKDLRLENALIHAAERLAPPGAR